MQIHTLRVKRSDVGQKFPFDRVYLVKHADRGVIAQLFRYALVMPVDKQLVGMLQEIELDSVLEREIERDDEAATPRKPDEKFLGKLIKSTDWHMIVPILSKWIYKSDKMKKSLLDQIQQFPGEGDPTDLKLKDASSRARYLMSPKWYKGRAKYQHKDKTPLPHQAYLLRDGQTVRPICVACPRMIQHQNGECQVGEKVCYEALSLGMKNHFRDGLTVPPPSVNIKEMDDGIVLEDLSGID